jgi:hypothetical protein
VPTTTPSPSLLPLRPSPTQLLLPPRTRPPLHLLLLRPRPPQLLPPLSASPPRPTRQPAQPPRAIARSTILASCVRVTLDPATSCTRRLWACRTRWSPPRRTSVRSSSPPVSQSRWRSAPLRRAEFAVQGPRRRPIGQHACGVFHACNICRWSALRLIKGIMPLLGSHCVCCEWPEYSDRYFGVLC